MIPKYQVSTFTGAVNDYNITSEASIIIKERLTDSVGQFAVTLPSSRQYEDIALHDTIKFYLGYDTIPGTPAFVGKITKIEGTLIEKEGYYRKLSGLALGEVLLRRLKCGHYLTTDASDIVHELADDLGLGTGGIVADAHHPELEFVDETYFDALQSLSDNWISAGVLLKKDFMVDVDSHLIYQDRPWRTTNVETFAIGTNIDNYTVRRSLENVKNNIIVYGNWDERFTTNNPSDENWTEPDAPLTNWTATNGTLSRDGADMVVGTYSVKCHSAGAGIAWDVTFYRHLKPDFAFVSGNARTITKSFTRLHFHVKGASPSTADYTYLLAPDLTNYYYRATACSGGWDTLNFELPTTDDLNGWTEGGSPLANYITGIKWNQHAVAEFDYRVDGVALQGGRFTYKTSDATSIAAYGQRDLAVIEDSLQSSNQCASRGETLLYQKKDPLIEIDIATKGNTNILVGDRLTLTLPRESINAYYYAIAVDHSMSDAGFKTKFTGSDTISNRNCLPTTPGEEIGNIKKEFRALFRDVRASRL
jgi:hypothetical protein